VKLRVTAGNKNREERKIVNMLQIPDWKKEYAIEIHNRFEILTNMEEEVMLTKLLMESGKTLKQ
jgi:hypothetical protein